MGFQVGWQQPVYLQSPAAGQFWSRKVDGRYSERLLLATFTLVTSAVVANRFIALQLLDQNNVLITSVPVAGAVVASTVVTPCLQVGGPAYGSGGSGPVNGFLPDLITPGDWTWKTSGFNLDAGDQFSGIVLVVQQFPNDSTYIPAGD